MPWDSHFVRKPKVAFVERPQERSRDGGAVGREETDQPYPELLQPGVLVSATAWSQNHPAQALPSSWSSKTETGHKTDGCCFKPLSFKVLCYAASVTRMNCNIKIKRLELVYLKCNLHYCEAIFFYLRKASVFYNFHYFSLDTLFFFSWVRNYRLYSRAMY